MRQQARRDLLSESRKYHAVKLLRQIPSIGPIRAALLVAQLQTPHRFRTKRQFKLPSRFVFNARSDSLLKNGLWKAAFEERRCIVPADSFFEWVRPVSRSDDCPAWPHGRTCRPIGSTLLPLEPWTHRRRNDLLNLLAMLDGQLEALNDAVTQVAQQYPDVHLLMSQPGVGAVTALAFVLTVGDVRRFPRGKQVASYLGLIPREHSSGGKQRMGGISKQGNRLLRFLLVEAANIGVRFDPELRKEYLHRCHHKHFTVAKVAAARKLASRLRRILSFPRIP